MLDKKLKEQIYYGNNQPKKEFDNKAFYTLVAVIVGFALIVAVISLNSNNTTHYEQPKQERNLDNLVGEQTESTQKEEIPEEKTYTEAEIQADINKYKNQFIAKVKPNWHPNEESFLIDNNSLQVKVDKNGNVTFPEFDNIGYSNANTDAMKYAVENGIPYNKLPESYNKDYISFKIYFEGNTESYWGNAQPKSSYQVSLSPIKTATKPKTTTNNAQKSSSNNSMDEFKKLNAPHGSNARLNNEFSSFDNDNMPQRTREIINMFE